METNTLLSFENLIDAVGGSLIGSKSSSFCFSSAAIDSRKCVKNSLFVPLIGSVQNGHIYIRQALESGASVVFVANSELSENKANFENLAKEFNATFIAVENTMTALQKAAKRYVEQFPSLIKIGVTGSSGKTTTKEIIASVLSQKYSVVTNEGNLNSETGLPLSVFKIRAEHEVGIFEMGMNRRGEISEIASVLFPSIAVITNIGTAHIGILGTQDAIAEEKKMIFSNFSENCIGFVPENDKYASFLQKVKDTVSYYPIVEKMLKLGKVELRMFFSEEPEGNKEVRVFVDDSKEAVAIPFSLHSFTLLESTALIKLFSE